MAKSFFWDAQMERRRKVQQNYSFLTEARGHGGLGSIGGKNSEILLILSKK